MNSKLPFSKSAFFDWLSCGWPACDPDGVELRPEGVAVAVGVAVELVVVLESDNNNK